MANLDKNLEFDMFGDQPTSPTADEYQVNITRGPRITDELLVKASTNLRFKKEKLYKDGRKSFLTTVTHLSLNSRKIKVIENLQQC